MDEEKKQQALKQIKRGEGGDTARSDNDLERSKNYASKNAKFKAKYKEYYTDIKLSSKEDW